MAESETWVNSHSRTCYADLGGPMWGSAGQASKAGAEGVQDRGVIGHPSGGGQPARVRILLVDDQPAYRNGLAAEVKTWPEFELVGVVDGSELLPAVERLTPSVLVVDLTTRELSEAELLGATGESTRVLFMAAAADSERVYGAIANGAKGYLLKSYEEREVCAAIAAIARGESAFAPSVQEALVKEMRLREQGGPPVLSARERDVLVLMAAGLKAPEIGRRLNVSSGTVRTHMKHIYEQLEVNDRAAAVFVAATRWGLLE